MSSHRVSLAKVSRCPSCAGEPEPRTEPTGTRIVWQHAKWCRIGRTVLLAGWLGGHQ